MNGVFIPSRTKYSHQTKCLKPALIAKSIYLPTREDATGVQEKTQNQIFLKYEIQNTLFTFGHLGPPETL